MNKKEYLRPSMKVAAIHPMQMIAASDLKTNNEVSSNPSYSRTGNFWDDDDD
jgi:hypothetical protein